MKKYLTIISIIFTVLLLTYMLMFVFVKLSVKAAISNIEIQKYLNRQLAIEQFSFSGLNSYEVLNYKISNVPNFNSGLLTSINKIQIKANLFNKNLISLSLNIYGINANLNVKELSNLPNALANCPFKLNIPFDNIKLSSATVRILNNKSDKVSVITIENISLKIKNILSKSPIDFTVNFKVTNGNENFTVYAKCVFDIKNQELKIVDATVVSDNSAVYIKGVIAQIFSNENMNFNIEILGDKNVVNKIVNVFSKTAEAELDLKPKTKLFVKGSLNKTLIEIEQ